MRIFRRSESGASAVEFGLVLPVLVMILLGLIDYGWVFFVRLNMTNAAREGARHGITRSDEGIARQVAEQKAKDYLTAANLAVAADPSSPGPGEAAVQADPSQPAAGDPNAMVKITVTIADFEPLVGFVPTPASMTVSAQMRWELAEPSE